MKKPILMLSFILLITGCATTHMVKPGSAPDLNPQPDKATLVMIRDTFFGGAIVFWSYLDDQLIGETKGRTYFVTTVEPGPHNVVVATENTCVAQFDFKPGKTYFLGQKVAMGAWRARTAGFYPLTPDEAAKAMKSCTYLEYDPKSGPEKMDSGLYQQAINEYLEDVRKNPDAFADVLEYDGVVMK